MNDLVSIIVPIYKVEKYLNKCIESIVHQTYDNLEIILVDDGSPDNCPQMCDDWAKKDSRIKVIHKSNGGLSDARNFGIEIATGQYIAFIDSDDYISNRFIEILYNTLIQDNSDIVECEVLKFFEGEVLDNSEVAFCAESFDTKQSLSLLISDNIFHQYVWNKLYKANLVKCVPFERGKLNEDEFWTYQIFGKALKVTKINLPLYFYLQRSTSIMGTSYNIKRLDALEAKSERQKYIEQYFPSLATQAKISFFSSCIYACQSVIRFMEGEDKKKALTIVNKYAKENCLVRKELRTLKRRNKFWLSFACKNFFMCCKIRNILRIGF